MMKIKRYSGNKPRHDWTSHGADAFRYLAIVWKDEAKITMPDEPIRGLFVGKTEVSLNDLWKETKVKANNRI